MGYYQLIAEILKNVGISVPERSKITITAGKGQNRIYLTCTSCKEGIALLEQVTTQMALMQHGVET